MTTLLKTNTTSLIVIDSRVTDWKSLIGDLAANATLLVLDPLRDGLTQIAEAVANSVNIDAIHIISHGNTGSLLLGSSTLNSSNLSDYQAQLASIGNALSINGDILLYGCDVAQSDIGQQFIEQLSVLTGADIAASTNLTGAVNKGGDWVLEAVTGIIESPLAFSTTSLNSYTDILVLPVISLSPTFSNVTEGNTGTSVVTITATLSAASASTVMAIYSTSDLAAIAGSDYVAASGLLTFAAGETTKTFDILINGDTVYESNEMFSINLSPPIGAVLPTDGGSVYVTIMNDDVSLLPIVSLSPAMPSVMEGNVGTSIVTMTATLSAAASSAVTVNYATSDFSALAGSDYIATNGILTFAAGETTKTFDILINGDTIYESDEFFTINLSTPSGVVLPSTGGSVYIGIVNDDISLLPTISISPNDSSVMEGNAGTSIVTMAVILSAGASSAVTVNYTTYDTSALAGSDYVATNGTLTFAAGEIIKTFDIIINGDTVVENNEYLSASLSAPTGAVLSSNSHIATITIMNDDVSLLPTISLSPSFPMITEGNTGISVATITATLSAVASSAVTVNYATSNLDAIAGSDYVASNGLLTFAAGETTKIFNILINGDTLYESNEFFAVGLSTPTGAVLTSSSSTIVTIVNDDVMPVIPIISLSPTFPWVTEGNIGTSTVTMTVTLSAAATSVVTVNYATSDLAATAGSDYIATNGILTFAAGETTKTINITINGDTVYENNESFLISLSTPTGAVLSSPFGASTFVTIENDDVIPLVFATPATVNYTDTIFVDPFAPVTGTLSAVGTGLTYGIAGTLGVDVTDNLNGTVSKSNAYGKLTVTKVGGAYIFTPTSETIEALKINPTDSDNTLNVTVSDGSQTVSKPFTIVITQSGTTESNGNDTLIGTSGNNIFDALAGDDSIDGGAGSDSINGGLGNDTLDGGASDSYNLGVIDRLNGGAGNDTFLARGFFGAGIYNGGLDIDTLDFSQSDTYTAARRSAEGAGVNVDLATGKATTYYLSASNFTWADANGQLTLTNIESVIGTNQNDLLYGDGNANTLEGGAGNDVLYGAGGVDVLKGGTGNDTYYVGYAGDVLDTVTESAGEGNDMVWSALSAYTLADNVEILGLLAGAASGTGNADNNSLIGNSASNTLNGGLGNDSLDGGVSDVYNPTVTDTLNGDAGNDTFLARGFCGAGIYDGGADNDWLDFSQADAYTAARRSAEGAGVSVNLANNKATTYYLNASNFTWADPNGQLSLTSIENVRGSSQSDLISGDSFANILDGGASDSYNLGVIDRLNGGAGNDTFLARGFFGAGIYNGGADIDTLDFSQADAYTTARRSAEGAGVSVDLATGKATTYYLSASNFTWTDANGQFALTNIENVIGTNQGDRLSGDANNNLLEGRAGNDVLVGGEGADTFIGGQGKDINYLTETTASTDTVSIAAGDSLVTSYDLVNGFGLGTGSDATGVDNLHLASTLIATGAADGTDVGTGSSAISSHSITNGIISFDNLGAYDTPVAITASTNLANVFSYLQANIGGNETVAFVSDGNTFVFQDGGATDTLVELVGVMAHSVSTTGLVTGSVWIV